MTIINLFAFLFLIFLNYTNAFLPTSKHSNNNRIRHQSLQMFDIPYIPALVVTAAGVFAGLLSYYKILFYTTYCDDITLCLSSLCSYIYFYTYDQIVFNIDNKVDLTDRGRAEARKKKRQEREARGEFRTPKDPNADPYRYI